MQEKFPEQCRTCPNRSTLSRAMARIAGKPELVDGCEGMVTVSHGLIETETCRYGEPAPDRSKFNWHTMSGSDHGKTYTRTIWQTEQICGRESIEPREGEIPFSATRPTWVAEDGSRHAAFITGEEVALQEHFSVLSIMDLLDATTEMQRAEAEGDADALEAANRKIGVHGFAVAAIASDSDDGEGVKTKMYWQEGEDQDRN